MMRNGSKGQKPMGEKANGEQPEQGQESVTL